MLHQKKNSAIISQGYGYPVTEYFELADPLKPLRKPLDFFHVKIIMFLFFVLP
jgi:hypothetical protein